MGFLSHRRQHVEVHPEQKWDFITLNDFKSTSCFEPWAYAYLWFCFFISIAVYAIDTFTAVQLLVFNEWSSQIKPPISFDVAKWIFSVCILLSIINLAYEYLRAWRIMRRGSVAESFLDSLAARLECIRMGSGRGWKRFLVFSSLAKSKKGAEIIALFTFFSFQSWIRVLICSGPRQVVNALTLYSVYNGKLQVEGNNFESSISSFFEKIRALAMEDYRQAVILSGMLFTLVVWVFSFLALLLAGLFFILYLWRHIPRQDGGLTGFCERKINKRLKQVVNNKIEKAMADDERKRKKAGLKEAMKNGGGRPLTMKPSLPVFSGTGDELPEMPSLKRADTLATLSGATLAESRPGTPGSFEMNALGQKRSNLTRTATATSSATQFSSRAPLVSSAADMGLGGPIRPGTSGRESPTPTLPVMDRNYPPYPPLRTGTNASNRSFGADPRLQRMPSNGSMAAPGYTASPEMYSSEKMPTLPPLALSAMGNGPKGFMGSEFDQGNSDLWPSAGEARPTFDGYPGGYASPAPPVGPYRGPQGPASPRGTGPGGYPMRSATNPMPPRGPPQRFAPQRNMTAPVQPYDYSDNSNGSMRDMRPPQRPYHQGNGSNGSLRSMTSPSGQPYHQQSASNSSLRNMTAPGVYPPQESTSNSNNPMRTMTASGPYPPQERANNGTQRSMTAPSAYSSQGDNSYEGDRGRGDYGVNRPNPMTSPRGPPPRRDYGDDNGWDEDVERVPRYR